MNIDFASLTTTPISLYRGSDLVSQGTGFFYVAKTGNLEVVYLVTNHHVVTGYPPTENNQPIGNRISFHLHLSADDPGQIRTVDLPLFTKNGKRLWLACGSFPEADVAIIPVPVKCRENLKVSCLDETTAKPVMKTRPTTPIALIGYPYGLYDKKNALPIWKSGTIASEPDVDFEGKPVFLVDISAFPGMSGSPAFAYASGGYDTLDGGVAVTPGITRQFMGIYASMTMRHEKRFLEQFTNTTGVGITDKESLQIGHVWKAKLITDTIANIDIHKYENEILSNM